MSRPWWLNNPLVTLAMSISLCMIVKDEAETLPQCLGSVRDWVDDMIILDTGSQDETVAIARVWGAQVTTIPWRQDFAAARNQSLAAAKGDWILVLDADETLTSAGQEVLQRVQADTSLGGQSLASVLLITLLRHEVHADQAPYSAVSRLFRNRPDIRFERPYHESVDDSVTTILAADPQWQVLAWPEIALTHTGYEADTIAQRDKFGRAQTIMAAYLADHPQDAYICNKLGALYGRMGQWETGRSLLQQGLAVVEDDPATTYELHYHLGLAERATGQLDQAAQQYRAALAQAVPEVLKVGAYINLGSVYQAQTNYPEAVQQFERAILAAPQFAMAHFNLGTAQRAQGQLAAAITAYRQAIALEPSYAEAYQNLGVALFKMGKVPDSLQAFHQAIALYQTTNPAAAQRLQQGMRNLGFSIC